MLSNNRNKGIYLALLTALISGVAIFVNKFAVDAIKPPLVFTAVKNFGVGIFILGFILSNGKWRKIGSLSMKEIVYLLLIGIIGGAIPFYLYFTGLSMIPAVNASLIHKSLVLWVAILALPLLKEKLTKTEVVAVCLLFASNYIIGGFKGFQFSQGELLVLIATMFWAVENILAKKILPKVDPDLVTMARMGFGSLILMGAAAIVAPAGLAKVMNMNSTQWFWMALTVATLLGYVMSWYRALKYAPAVTVTAVLVSATLVTNILSAVFVTHAWNITMMIQAIVMALGVGIFYFAAKKKILTSKPTLESSV